MKFSREPVNDYTYEYYIIHTKDKFQEYKYEKANYTICGKQVAHVVY